MKKTTRSTSAPTGLVEIACVQENLKKALALVSRAIPSRSTLPVLSNILLQTDQGRVKLVATNLEIALTCWVDAKIEGEGAITLPAKLLSDIVNGLPNDRVTFHLDMTKVRAHLTCQRYECSLHGIEADEFPTIPTVDSTSAQQVVFPADLLKEALDRVAGVAATDNSRPILTGVHVRIQGTQALFAATDGLRLARHTLELPDPVTEPLDVVIPAHALQEVGRMIGDDPITMLLTANQGQALFRTEGVELVTRLIDGTFPDVDRVIPTSWQTRLVVDTAVLAKIVRVAGLLVVDFPRAVHVHARSTGDLSPGMLTVTTATQEIGTSSAMVECIIGGEDIALAFNATLISDALRLIATPQVALEIHTPTTGVAFKPVGQENYVHVVMPLTPPKGLFDTKAHAPA